MSAQVPECSFKYHPHDTSVVFHDEPDERALKRIEIPLPDPPALHEIDGYGLPPKLQKFQHEVMPPKLVSLQNKRINDEPITLEEIYEILDRDQSKYRAELLWIERQWKRRLYGYWFFNNGKPTFIDGWHYVFLNNWCVDSSRPDGLPMYRDRDRKWFHVTRHFYNDPHTFGIIYPKMRREGATFRSQCVGYCIVTEGFKKHMTIQSMSEGHAKEVFDYKLKDPWSKMWFFWKPIHNGSTNPSRAIVMKPAGKTQKGRTLINSGVKTLGGEIRYYPSGEKAVDGKKVHFAHQDELGKRDKVTFSVYERWRIVRECLDEGGVIVGFALGTSTVEEMKNGGGQEMYDICKDSYDHERGEVTKRTTSGLVNIFIPSYDGYAKFVDEYGMSIIEDPEKPIKNCLGELVSVGAKTYFKEKQAMLIQREDWAGLASERRKYPQKFMDCFVKSGEETGFNIEALNDGIEKYTMGGEKLMKKGYFRWVNNVRFGKVEFVPNPNNPKFLISREPLPHMRNPVTWSGHHNSFVFVNGAKGKFLSSADPVKYSKVKGKAKSNGGGAVFGQRDYSIDPEGTPIESLVTNKFCCTYDNVVNDTNELLEDLLMMCWYYGAPMYSENNIPAVNDYFIDAKCRELLLFDINQQGKREVNAGFYSNETTKNIMFTNYMNYIDTYGRYEKHGDLLIQCRDITGLDDMTNYDLFTAGGGCLLALDNRIIKRYSKPEEQRVTIDIGYTWR